MLLFFFEFSSLQKRPFFKIAADLLRDVQREKRLKVALKGF